MIFADEVFAGDRLRGGLHLGRRLGLIVPTPIIPSGICRRTHQTSRDWSWRFLTVLCPLKFCQNPSLSGPALDQGWHFKTL